MSSYVIIKRFVCLLYYLLYKAPDKISWKSIDSEEFITILALIYIGLFEVAFNNIFDLFIICILLVFSLKPILFKILSFLLSLEYKYFKKVSCIEKLADFILEWPYLAKRNYYKRGESIIFIFLSILYYFQKKNTIRFVDFKKENLGEILALFVGVIAIYGIFVAFLQFIKENDNFFYLGESKIIFLLENSIWLVLIRTKTCYILLLSCLVLPIFYQVYDWIEIYYLWQSLFLIQMIICVFLLKTIIQLIFLVFNFNLEVYKEKYSISNIQNNRKELYKNRTYVEKLIARSIQREYKKRFWEGFSGNSEIFIYKELLTHCSNIKEEEKEELIFQIYTKSDFLDFTSFSASIEDYRLNKEHLGTNELEKFYKYYSKYCEDKRKFIDENITLVDDTIIKELLDEDERIISDLENYIKIQCKY